jgi:hypothetical protein
MNIYQVIMKDDPYEHDTYESYVIRANNKKDALTFFEKETGDNYMAETNITITLLHQEGKSGIVIMGYLPDN